MKESLLYYDEIIHIIAIRLDVHLILLRVHILYVTQAIV